MNVMMSQKRKTAGKFGDENSLLNGLEIEYFGFTGVFCHIISHEYVEVTV